MLGGIYAAGHWAVSPGGPGARHSLATQPGPNHLDRMAAALGSAADIVGAARVGATGDF